jgi:nucleobase:cation symporter-1, NCS1 family
MNIYSKHPVAGTTRSRVRRRWSGGDGGSAVIDREAVEAVETRLLPVPESARTSTAGHQFWIWAGANIAPINWVLGALGIQLGLSLAQTMGVLVLGNLIGMSAFGFFVLMGQKTGVSQMVQARSAFGRRGAYLPAAIQFLISALWCAVNTWIVLDLVLALLGKLGYHDGGTALKLLIIFLVMGVQTWLAVRGFELIAKFERYTVPVTFVVLLAMTIFAWSKGNVHWGYPGGHLHGAALLSAEATIMTAIGIGWGCTWFAYASDYSRFLPTSMPKKKVFFASVFGQFLPVVWLGLLGATLATVSQKVDPGSLVVNEFGVLAIPVLLLVLHGPIATNILNIYSSSLCAQTLDWNLNRRKIAALVGAIATAFGIFLVFQTSFGNTLDTWLSGLVMWIAPWGTITLIHYYYFLRQEIDVESLYDPPGRSRIVDVRWSAIIAFLIGAFAAWCFEYGEVSWLQGPIANAIGKIDMTWLVGSIVAGAVYLVIGRPSKSPLYTKSYQAELEKNTSHPAETRRLSSGRRARRPRRRQADPSRPTRAQ